MKRFEGKVALVTGGNSGIGLGAAKAFARESAQVIITGRNKSSLEAAAKEIGSGAWALQADAAKIADIEALMSTVATRYKKLDALFVNAGVGEFLPFDQVTETFFDHTMSVNLKGVFFTIQKALPLLAAGSSVVINASINARLAMPGTSVYGPSKAAVVNLMKILAIELADKKIRVNAISPGPIESALLARGSLSPQALSQTKEWIVGQVPMKRFGTPEETAEAVLYLTSAASGFVTGTDLVIDGGMSL